MIATGKLAWRTKDCARRFRWSAGAIAFTALTASTILASAQNTASGGNTSAAGSEAVGASLDRTDLDPETTESGFYFDIFGVALFGLESTHEWKRNCPEVTDPMTGDDLALRCDARNPIGGALGVRLGLISRGVVGFEAFAIGAGDWSKVSLEGWDVPGVPASLESMQIGRVGGALGGGLRLSTPTTGVELGAGLGPGVAFRRVYTSVSSLDGASTNYAAPMLLGDVSVTFGKTLTLGVVAWAEFSKTISITPDLSSIPNAQEALSTFTQIERVTVFQGTQWFIGPMIAIHHGS